jgi:hypothetical protein
MAKQSLNNEPKWQLLMLTVVNGDETLTKDDNT